MVKGRSVFLLDLISNSLGAVLLLFLLLISRHFERPPPRVEGTLLVFAEAARPDARIGLWATPPGSDGERLFTDALTGLAWNPDTGRYRAASDGPAGMTLDTFGQVAKFLRVPAEPDAGEEAEADLTRPSGAALLVPRPAKGCWVFGPYYEDTPALDDPEPVDTEIRLTVWFHGLLRRSGGTEGAPPRLFRAPTSQSRHCVEITEDGANPQSGCCADLPE